MEAVRHACPRSSPAWRLASCSSRSGRGAPATTPPANPAAPGTSWPEALGYAVASGAAMGLARMLATRKAAGYYRKSTGHLPPGMEEVT